jgi:FSR family fosmidomycin resistance protein-like MFS transporter
VYGAQSAALPAIRSDLQLSYEQIGVLLSLPYLVGSAIEPAIGILGDTWRRKVLIAGGGIVFAFSLLLIALGQSFLPLLLAFVLMFPASGAFVSLSQATLMDLNPARHDQLMARWTLFGSIGVVGGSLLLSGALAVANGSWRPLYLAFAVLMVGLVLATLVQPHPRKDSQSVQVTFGGGVRATLQALRSPTILRWLVLLDLADLMGDVLLEFVALYFVDVVALSGAGAALAVTTLSVAGLLGNILVIPLLERISGLVYVRASALVIFALYVLLLLVPVVALKFALLAAIGLSAAGWHAVLRGRLYSAMPNQSGISMAVSSVWGVATGLIPGLLGFVAGAYGLPWTMALLALGPLGLIVLLPRNGGR